MHSGTLCYFAVSLLNGDLNAIQKRQTHTYDISMHSIVSPLSFVHLDPRYGGGCSQRHYLCSSCC